MQVLQVHNYYRTSAPSGENKVVDAERKLLRENGHVVEMLVRHNDDLDRMGAKGALIGAAATAWNPFARRAMKTALADFDADVVHVHNTFPQLSPAIFPAISGRQGRVITLHNYRTVCPAALPMREGEVCTECIDTRSALPALRYGCYRSSRLATLPLAAKVMAHRAAGTWRNHVDAFIVFTQFQRELMAKAGFPRELIHIKPNFFPDNPAMIPFAKRAERVLFVGRLTPEKGVQTLIEAWRQWGETAPPLRILGDGELRSVLEEKAAGLPIEFFGQVDPEVVVREVGNARLVVVPSQWFEGFPMVLQEAFALGTPAAVSEIGPLPSLVEEGELGGVFRPKDPASLCHEIQRLWSDQDALARKAECARKTFESQYTQGANLKALLEIYEAAMTVKQDRLTP
ncbi:MAG: glycosyltransferase family 4 protein [Pseudomonadota bacterium]